LQGVNYRDAAFAPSGNTLVFVANISGQDELWKASVQADGSLINYVQLTRGPAGQPASQPSWSSDGTAIIFQRGASADANAPQTLHTVRADGGGVRSLSINGSNPAWYGGGAAPSASELPRRAYLPLAGRR
jgi:Tol biopolymer transport system component